MTVPLPPSMVSVASDPVSRLASCNLNSQRHSEPDSQYRQQRSRTLPALVLAALALLLGAPLLAQSTFGSIAVGTPSASQNVTVTAQTAGTVATVDVLTLGQPGLDYAATAAGSCAGANLSVGNTCTVPVTFTPTAPGLRPGAVLLLDSSNHRIGVTFLTGTGSGGLGVFLPGTMQTIAGTGAWTSVLDGNLATEADLDLPEGEVLDGAGNLYIADSAHNRVREVSASTGTISTLAGNGNPSYTGDGGLAINATLNTPASVALDGAGDLYIADSGNNVIRRIVLSTGIITTVAGTGTPGSGGDGGPATSATLDNPLGVSVDTAGNLYIADTYNHKIREVNSSGTIATLAGNGTTQSNGSGSYSGDNGPAISAGLNYPYAVAFDASGNLYIPDSGNNRIRVVNASTQVITTFAGTGVLGFSGDGGPATQAQLYSPSGVVFDPAGNLYIADTQNNRIRKVSALSGNIATIAGTGIGAYSGDNASAYAAQIYGPYGLTLDPQGNLLIADYFDHRIRRIQVNLATFNLVKTPVRQGSKSPTQPQTLEDDGTAALDLTSITPDSNSALDPTVTTCVTTTPLALNNDCVLGAQFAPNTSGNPLTATITTAANSNNSPLLIQITGDATAVNSTTTTLVATPSPTASFGQSIALQATVTTGSGTGALTGTVSFSDGSKTLISGLPISSSGTASYTVNNLTVGLHSLTASYSGDSGHFASTSTPPTAETVNEATATNLTSSANPSSVGAAVTFTATVTAPNGGGLVPDGSVNFLDNGTVIGAGTLNGTGTATFTTSTLANGQHSITAVYGGDSANYILGSTSAVLTQNVTAPTTTAVVAAPNPSGYGVAVTFTATVTPSGSVTPTGTVNFLDNGAQIGSGTLSGSPATASFTTSTLPAGQHSITAQYLGSSGNGASTSAPFSLTVSPVQTTTTVSAVPNPGIAGRPVTLTAAIHVLQGSTIPTGTVTFTDGATSLGTATVNASGTAALQVNLAAGQHSIVAAYSGSANDGSSTSLADPFTVQLATTQVAVTPAPNPAFVLAQVLFTVKVTGNGGTPTGPVTLLVDGKSTATANLDPTGTATIPLSTLTVGTHAISASYAGDANDAASASTAVNEVIQPIPSVTALGVTTTGAATQQAVLVATVVGVSGPTPTGTVQFLNGSSVIGSSALDSSGVATLVPNLPTGTYSIVAQYSGDAIHSPSTSQPASLSTAPSTFSLTLTPPALTLKTGQNGTLTVQIASVNQASDTITLGCANLPAAVNCHFATNDLKLVAGGAVTTQLTLDTNNPLSGGASISQSTSPTPSGSQPSPTLAGLPISILPLAGLPISVLPLLGLPLLGLPLTALLGWLLWRARRRAQRWLVLVLLLAVSLGGLALSGCGGFSQTTATPGAYTIQVTGIGTQSNQTHYVNLTLTITQ